jgi:hypothetical protein
MQLSYRIVPDREIVVRMSPDGLQSIIADEADDMSGPVRAIL